MNAAVMTVVAEPEAQKLENLGRFASGIVHDFNGVLAAIGVYADMLARQACDANQKRCAERMLAATTRGRNLVGQLLTYIRSECPELEPVDARASAEGAVEMAQGLANESIHVEADIPQSPLVVMADATQLEQVITNLCSNAIHAMEHGGTLRVSLAEVHADRTRLSHGELDGGSYAVVRVQDEGSGMDKATLARAFEPFFTTRKLGRGTGLGLAIVKGMVERFGGAIDVRTAVGRGTCFAVYLPLTQLPLGAAAASTLQ